MSLKPPASLFTTKKKRVLDAIVTMPRKRPTSSEWIAVWSTRNLLAHDSDYRILPIPFNLYIMIKNKIIHKWTPNSWPWSSNNWFHFQWNRPDQPVIVHQRFVTSSSPPKVEHHKIWTSKRYGHPREKWGNVLTSRVDAVEAETKRRTLTTWRWPQCLVNCYMAQQFRVWHMWTLPAVRQHFEMLRPAKTCLAQGVAICDLVVSWRGEATMNHARVSVVVNLNCTLMAKNEEVVGTSLYLLKQMLNVKTDLIFAST